MSKKGLNDISASYYTQWSSINTLFNASESSDAINSIEAVSDGIPLWDAAFEKATAYNNKANAGTTGITSAKNDAKKTASTSGSGQSGKGVSYSILTNAGELNKKMGKLTMSYLYSKTTDADFAGVIKSIDDSLRPYLTSDPVVAAKYFTLVSLDEMMGDKKAFVSSMGKYAGAIGAINGAKSDIIVIQKPIMDEQIKYFEGFMNDLYTKYPDFVNSFRAITKKLDTIGKRNQGLSVEMVDSVSGLPLGLGGIGAITNYPAVKKAKTEKTNTMGVLPLMNLKVGIWKTKFSFAGYITQYGTVTIAFRKVVSIKVLMVAVPPPPF